MASSNSTPILLCLLFCFAFVGSSNSTPTLKPNKLVLPVHKDASTGLHVTYIHKRTPPLQLHFVVDLNGEFLWVNCDKSYLSSTYHAPLCHSTQCSRASTHYCRTCPSDARPGCHNNTCGVMSTNPVTRRAAMGELAQDVLAIQSTQGSNPGPMYTISSFLFACAPPALLHSGLPRNVHGVAGLGHTQIGLPTQVASHFGFPPKFAMCLSPSSSQFGAIFFGEGPYTMLPGVDVSRPAISSSTPLIVTPKGDYYVGLKSIKINNKEVNLNTNLLSIDAHGMGGTRISTTAPYSVLEHSIYRAVSEAFAKEMAALNQHQVRAVGPFGLCYDGTKMGSSKMGPRVPSIDFVMANQNVAWRISGANSMVEARRGVMCLGFVDGGSRMEHGLMQKAAVVIGVKQMEDNLVQFDLVKSRVGFSSSLLGRGTSCANFNFTATSPTAP